MANWTNRLTTNPKILGGKPIIKGTRISVEFIMELLTAKMTPDEIVKEYPHLTKRDIYAVLNYATEVVKREEIILTPKLVYV